MASNTEIVHAIYEPWSRGDWFGSGDWAQPDIEYIAADGPAPATAHGLVELGQLWRETINVFSDFRVEVEEVRELDDGRILVLTRNSGEGKTSGLELGQITTLGANLLELRDGKVARMVAYFDRENAIRDAALPPPP